MTKSQENIKESQSYSDYQIKQLPFSSKRAVEFLLNQIEFLKINIWKKPCTYM